MNSSILWNGFEIKKGLISTDEGCVPYLLYSPEISRESVNIAIHGENSSKDEWLCFNSKSKLGNLLKESIKMNSPFLALDLYGHGEWLSEDRSFYPGAMNRDQEEEVIIKSSRGISQAIDRVLNEEGLINNPLTITAVSKGCSIALNIESTREIEKILLLSPSKSEIKTRCNNFLIFRGESDITVTDDDFFALKNELSGDVELELYKSSHEIPEAWINRAKSFIYSR